MSAQQHSCVIITKKLHKIPFHMVNTWNWIVNPSIIRAILNKTHVCACLLPIYSFAGEFSCCQVVTLIPLQELSVYFARFSGTNIYNFFQHIAPTPGLQFPPPPPPPPTHTQGLQLFHNYTTSTIYNIIIPLVLQYVLQHKYYAICNWSIFHYLFIIFLLIYWCFYYSMINQWFILSIFRYYLLYLLAPSQFTRLDIPFVFLRIAALYMQLFTIFDLPIGLCTIPSTSHCQENILVAYLWY